MSSQSLALIVACTAKNGIGKDGGLPWRLPKEMGYFARATSSAPAGKHNAVIMGRNTWESIPSKFRPLKDRFNIVVTSRDLPEASDVVLKVNSLQSAMDALLTHSEIHNVFVIGGAKLYAAALEHPGTCRLFITRVLSPEYDCDTFFPPIQDSQQWRQASYAELLKELELDKTVIGQQTEEKGAWWEPQLWIRS